MTDSMWRMMLRVKKSFDNMYEDVWICMCRISVKKAQQRKKVLMNQIWQKFFNC